MERTLWTDERLNDAMARIDQRFDALERRFGSVDRRLDAVVAELISLNRRIGQLGWAIAGAMFMQLVAIIITRAGT